MNVVKMQDSLKDFSDRQLLQTMESGSAPQYLVLAEMQRRKKARENPANTEPQPETSVADDIMGGITGLPMRPMQMAEGGIVSFAAGGKTGRMKGEEEACWTDTRTGEKYCPPDTPQTEMPRTGQRKSFQEGGMVPPDEMANIEVQKRLQELRAANPNATEYDTIQDLMREGSSVVPAMYGSDTPSTSAAQASPAESMPQPEPMSEPFQDGIGSLPVVQPGGDDSSAGMGTSFPAGRGTAASEGISFSDISDFFTRDAGVEGDRRSRRASRYEGAAEEAQADTGGMDDTPPPSGRMAAASERLAERESREADDRPAGEPTGDDEEAELNRLAPAPEPPPQPTQPQQPEYQDGLMQRMEELRAERDRTEDGARKEAINQALIQAGLSMMASDNPDFLGALGEGGIQGLAAYSGAQQAAQERQGAIGDEMTDLMIAREANDLRRQAADARAAGALSDQAFARVNTLQNQLEDINTQLAENPTMEDEAKAQLTTRRDQIRQALDDALSKVGIDLSAAGGTNSGPANRDNVTIDGE